MADLVQSLSDQRIQLGAEEIIRPMRFGSNWIKLRIGMRLSFNGIARLANGYFVVGVCQGSSASSGFTAASPTDYWGVSFGPGPTDFVYNLGSPQNYYFTNSGNPTLYHRLGTTSTNTNFGAASSYHSAAPARSIYMVTFTKTGGNIVAVPSNPANLSSVADATQAQLLNMMDDDAGSGWSAIYTNMNSWTLTLAQGGGGQAMDSVSIYWNHSTPTVEISDLCVVKLQ